MRRRRPEWKEVSRSRQMLVWIAMFVALGGVLMGCGDRRLVVKVDVLTFLSPSQTTASYGPVPPGTSGSAVLTQNVNVNLLSGVGGVVEVETLEFSVAGVFDNQNGDGQGTICVLFAEAGGAVVDSLQFPFVLAEGRADTVEAAVVAGMALANLFSQESLDLSLRIQLSADPNGAALQGDFELTRLLAVLTTRREG